MTLWIVDASVLVSSEDPDDANHRAASELLAGDEPVGTLDLAFYEVANVAVRAWQDSAASQRLVRRVAALAGDGGLLRVDDSVIDHAASLAADHGISVYDAAYVAASVLAGGELVSCDVRDLVSKGLARLPADALRPPG